LQKWSGQKLHTGKSIKNVGKNLKLPSVLLFTNSYNFLKAIPNLFLYSMQKFMNSVQFINTNPKQALYKLFDERIE
jgi:hypothetical protein